MIWYIPPTGYSTQTATIKKWKLLELCLESVIDQYSNILYKK